MHTEAALLARVRRKGGQGRVHMNGKRLFPLLAMHRKSFGLQKQCAGAISPREELQDISSQLEAMAQQQRADKKRIEDLEQRIEETSTSSSPLSRLRGQISKLMGIS